jgi:cell surface protein SprA
VNFAADPCKTLEIMRSLNSTNFEQGNVDYIQFWVMDPYIGGAITQNNSGKLYFNLGDI